MSNAFPKKVHINGSVKIHTPPITVYNQKNAITDKTKSIQYKTGDFFVPSIILNFSENNTNALISKSYKLSG
jgi:hypothetical protein